MKNSFSNSQNIKTGKINNIIDSQLSGIKFQADLNTLIMSTLSNRKSVLLSRSKIVDKVSNTNFIKEVENEILENLLKTFEIETLPCYDKNKEKDSNYLNVKETKKNLRISNNEGSTTNNKKKEFILIRDSVITEFSTDNNNANLDSAKLFNILIEEFLSCENKLKIENYIGDLSNFDADLILQNDNFSLILEKIIEFLQENTNSTENFLIPNVINFFSNISKNANARTLLDILIIFLNYFHPLIEKFYKSNFDITKFYKISFNVECLNNMIHKFYGKKELMCNRTLQEDKIKIFLDKLFACVFMNYEKSNPVYMENENNNLEFGLSTNYILLLLFLFDNDFSIFKIIFRNSRFRNHIIKNYSYRIKSLAFIDCFSCVDSFSKKFCFLWKHFSVLEQIFPNTKISKKFLLYSWVSIKLHFLGIMLRYNIFRVKLYVQKRNSLLDVNNKSTQTQIQNSLNCFSHFQNVFSYLIDIIFKNNNSNSHNAYDEVVDLEENNKDILFYQIKEILCDFIIYCTSESCIERKLKLVNDFFTCKNYNTEKKFKWLLEDLLLALKNNYYSPLQDNKE